MNEILQNRCPVRLHEANSLLISLSESREVNDGLAPIASPGHPTSHNSHAVEECNHNLLSEPSSPSGTLQSFTINAKSIHLRLLRGVRL